MFYTPRGSPPRAVGALSAWLTADPPGDLPLYQTEGGVRATLNNHRVGFVDRLARNLPTWENDDADERPTLKSGGPNGRFYLNFDGVDDYIDSGEFAQAAGWEAWIVCKFAGDVVTEQRPWSNPDDSLGIARMEVDPLAALVSFSTAQQVQNVVGDNSGAWHIWRYQIKAPLSSVSLDGVVVAAQGAPPFMPTISPTRWRMSGSYSAALPLKGDIAEFIGVQRILSDEAADKLYAWLDGRWGPLI